MLRSTWGGVGGGPGAEGRLGRAKLGQGWRWRAWVVEGGMLRVTRALS